MEQWKSDLFSDLFYTYPCGLVVTVFGLMVFLVGLATKQIAIAALGGLSIFFGLCSWAGSRIKSHPPPFPPTVQEKRKASKELLGVTQTVCPHCNAAYFYGSDRITRDGTVICQNCNQPIDLRSVSHET